MDQRYDDLTENLLEQSCWVIDILPQQVPAESPARYFAVEQFLMTVPQLKELYARFARLLLKLNCYYDLVLGMEEKWAEEPLPEDLWEERKRLCMEKIKKSELKMSFPLAIMLISLILMTSAPALMQIT